MFLLLKTDLMPLTREAVDELENYVLEFGIDIINGNVKAGPIYEAFMKGKMKKVTQMHRVELVLTKPGQTIMDILSPWFDFAAHSEGHTGAEWGAQLYGLLETLQVPERLYEWAQDAETVGIKSLKPAMNRCTMLLFLS